MFVSSKLVNVATDEMKDQFTKYTRSCKFLCVTMKESTKSDFTDGNSEIKIPGKIKLSESTISSREKDLKTLADNWKRERLLKEELDRKMFGFTKNSEILNGRTAMFFFMTGILTEIWTGQSIVTQIDTMLRTLGIL
mmetsp:Transcript_42502/g.66569  ORF Transcript_42502/g.66569 Transcript_42502/m.66569 type:complete len:137 (-) Transcript_42502:1789-2199(-)